MALIDGLLNGMVTNKASDLHLQVGQPPKYKVNGDIYLAAGFPALPREEVERLLFEILTHEQRRRYETEMDLEFAYAPTGEARFRCNLFHQRTGYAATFRAVPSKVPTVEELGLPAGVKRVAEIRSGLVLVAGPAGSGKTTTVAALVELINQSQKRHIITIEDPIEYVHQDAKSAISHRQVGTHTESMVAAMRAARWQDADVIVLGEMRDPEVLSVALAAASTGTLVIGTLPTTSAAKAIDRIIDAFPPAEQSQVRGTLAECLRAVVAQQLVKRKDGPGPRVPVAEVLLGSGALTTMIREHKTDGIVNLMQSGRAQGMQTMDDALERCVKEGRIAADEAYMRAVDKHRFEHYVVAQQAAAQVAARAGGGQQH